MFRPTATRASRRLLTPCVAQFRVTVENDLRWTPRSVRGLSKVRTQGRPEKKTYASQSGSHVTRRDAVDADVLLSPFNGKR
jgi:hypothetical protein